MNGQIACRPLTDKLIFSGNGVLGTHSTAVDPELCAMLGNAAAAVCQKGRIGVGFIGGPDGEAMKNAFVSGAQSFGALVLDFGSVMESEAVFAISALGLSLSAYITGGPDCSIKFLGVGGADADNETLKSIEQTISFGNFHRCCWNEYKAPADINGIKLLYRRELYSVAPSGLFSMSARPICSNPQGQQLFTDTLKQLGCNTDQGYIYRLSADGMSLSIEDSSVGVLDPQRICVLSCGAEFERHNDVVVPLNAPKEIERLAERYSRRVYRFGAGEDAELMARSQYRMRDGIITAVRLMAFMRERNITLEQMDMLF